MRAQKIEGDRYEVYEDGRIWSFFKGDWGSPTLGRGGYVRFSYRNKDGKRCCKTLHRIVYEAFVGPVPKEKEINHRDGNKMNNKLDNLELVTHSENIRHSYGMGLHPRKRGFEIARTKLSELEVNDIRRLYDEGWKRTLLAEKFKVAYPTIHRIISRKARSYVPDWYKITKTLPPYEDEEEKKDKKSKRNIKR